MGNQTENNNITTAVLSTKMVYITSKVDEIALKVDKISERLEKDYVTVEVFNFRVSKLESIVYGISWVFLLGFGTAIINFFTTFTIKK